MIVGLIRLDRGDVELLGQSRRNHQNHCEQDAMHIHNSSTSHESSRIFGGEASPFFKMAYAIVMKPGLAILATLGVLLAQNPDAAAFNPPWTPAETIQVGDLLKIFQKKNGTPIFYVGFAQLYKSKHIPGSIYAGPGRAEEGLAELKKAVAKVPKDSEIVLYCG